jgi:hypothetical protein
MSNDELPRTNRSMGRTLRNSTPTWPVTTRSESHLLVVIDDAEPVRVVLATVVEVTGGAVLLTTVVVAAGAAVEAGFVIEVAMGPFAVAQY